MWFNHFNSICEPFWESLPGCRLRGCHSNEIISHVTKMKSALASKIEYRREMRSILNEVVRRRLIEKVQFEQKLEGVEGTRQADILRKISPDEGTICTKSPSHELFWQALGTARRPVGDQVRGSTGPVHMGPLGPCENFGFYSKMIAIGRFWTGEWLNWHFNAIRLAAVYWKGAGAEQGGQLGDDCNDPGKRRWWLRPRWWQ